MKNKQIFHLFLACLALVAANLIMAFLHPAIIGGASIAICALTGIPKATTCGDIRSVSGIKTRIFLASKTDIDGYTTDSNGTISAIDFAYGKGLKEYYGTKDKSMGDQELKVGSGGNKYLDNKVTYILVTRDPADVAEIENLLGVDDIVAIAETKNGTFEVFGKENGLDVTSLKKSTGAKADDDNSFVLEFTGTEIAIVRQFLDTDYATSKATLESYVV